MKNNLFEFIPLGGLGEVGMNCSLFKFGEQKLVIDAGILFADSNDFGIEAILPDFWSLIDKEAPQSWFITHAHEDHIGALPFAFKVAQTLKKKMPQVYLPELLASMPIAGRDGTLKTRMVETLSLIHI